MGKVKQLKDKEQQITSITSTQATQRLILHVEDLARTIRTLCNKADISISQKRALTEAHRWLAEFGIEQETYDRDDRRH